ncbi:hypothetical protein SAMN05443549_101395 [Flavobacterium fluvii]|uniref:Uncharacterized protein n=1 Tax=Flavobacterium fluvii TaxID=468056 RepID=A0A1M5EME8_9FLAO|nr:hypothetical protein [Flavobacterium fluvii]SHF80271.1 hypothetical protein SAMN05443549_101395 [Flavobacterium fluvii]
MKVFIENHIKLLKEYYALIALIPTLLGGIWQFYKLGEMSFNMMRFFSITQLVSDGILILVFCFLPISFILPYINFKKKIKRNPEQEKLQLKKTEIILGLIMIALILSSIFLEIKTILKLETFKSLLYLLVLIHIIATIVYSVFLYLIKDEINQAVFRVIFCFILLSISITIAKISLENNIKDFKSIQNFQKLINTLKQNDSYSKEPEILYFNDKYIFIAIEKKEEKEIIIKKTDALFE